MPGLVLSPANLSLSNFSSGVRRFQLTCWGSPGDEFEVTGGGVWIGVLWLGPITCWEGIIGAETDGIGISVPGTTWPSVGCTITELSGLAGAGTGSEPGRNISSMPQPESRKAIHSAMAVDANRFIIHGAPQGVPLPPFLFSA